MDLLSDHCSIGTASTWVCQLLAGKETVQNTSPDYNFLKLNI